jgi:hypothetical protein
VSPRLSTDHLPRSARLHALRHRRLPSRGIIHACPGCIGCLACYPLPPPCPNPSPDPLSNIRPVLYAAKRRRRPSNSPYSAAEFPAEAAGSAAQMRAHELELAFTMHRERVDMANHRFWVSATGEHGGREKWRDRRWGALRSRAGGRATAQRMSMDDSMVPRSAVLRTAEVSRFLLASPQHLLPGRCHRGKWLCHLAPPVCPCWPPTPSAPCSARGLTDRRRPTTPTSRRSARSASRASRPPRTRQQQRTRRAARPRSPSSTVTGRLARARARRRGCARGGATCGTGSSCRAGSMLRGGGRGCVDSGGCG